MPKSVLDKPIPQGLFKTDFAYVDSFERIDHDKGVIYGTVAAELMEPKDYRSDFLSVDEEFLQQLVDFGNRSNKGIKARWTHPNMSSDGLGTFVGEHRNWRLSDDRTKVLTDMHLAEVAKNAPGKGDLWSYILDMADEHPEHFGQSVVIRYDEERMEELKDDDGVMPIRITALKSLDVVDEGNITRGFFHDNTLPSVDLRQLPEAATLALDRMFGSCEADAMKDRLDQFLDRYFKNRFGKTFTGGSQMTQRDDSTKPDDEVVEEKTTEETSETEETITEEPEVVETHSTGDDPALAERDRVMKIRKAAEFFGADEKSVDSLIVGGFSAEEAREALKTKFAKTGALEGIDAPETQNKPVEKSDEDKYGEEWEEYKQDLHCTKEQYIASRKRDAAGGVLDAPKNE